MTEYNGVFIGRRGTDCVRVWGAFLKWWVRCGGYGAFAFCHPRTLISKPSFYTPRFDFTDASASRLWPFRRGGSGLNLDHVPDCCSEVSCHSPLHSRIQCLHFHARSRDCVARANPCATQCHRAIIPTLAQWPRLNPGFDPPPNLSLQALG